MIGDTREYLSVYFDELDVENANKGTIQIKAACWHSLAKAQAIFEGEACLYGTGRSISMLSVLPISNPAAAVKKCIALIDDFRSRALKELDPAPADVKNEDL
jgi:hypothetical protein